jgi:predicted HTH domain antitoxin
MTVATYPPRHPWTVHELIELVQRRPEWVGDVINQAMNEDTEAWWAWVVDCYLDQQISLSKAAELLGVHPLELRDLFLDLGIPLRIGPADLAEARAEVEAARRWGAAAASDSSA